MIFYRNLVQAALEITPGQTLRGQTVIVPGDISSAAFWLVAAAAAGWNTIIPSLPRA